jgi:hypothetical protein
VVANFAKLPELRRRDGWSFVLNDPIDGDPTLRGGRCDHVAAGQITDSVRDRDSDLLSYALHNISRSSVGATNEPH